MQELRKALLGGNSPCLTDQRFLLIFVKIPKHASVLQKRGTGSFVLHLYHLRRRKYTTFLTLLLVYLQNSSK